MKLEEILHYIEQNHNYALHYISHRFANGQYDYSLDELMNNGSICLDDGIEIELFSPAKKYECTLATLSKAQNEDFYAIDIYENLSPTKINYFVYYYLAYIDLIRLSEKKLSKTFSIHNFVVSNISRFTPIQITKEKYPMNEHHDLKLRRELYTLKKQLHNFSTHKQNLEKETIDRVIKTYFRCVNINYYDDNTIKQK